MEGGGGRGDRGYGGGGRGCQGSMVVGGAREVIW